MSVRFSLVTDITVETLSYVEAFTNVSRYTVITVFMCL